MSVFSRLRVYHAAIAILAIAAYVTEDLDRLHVWIGYSLVGVIAGRLVLAAIAPRVLTPPHWFIRADDLSLEKGVRSPVIGKSILAAIMACMTVVLVSGVALDQKTTSREGRGVFISTALADDLHSDRKRNRPQKWIKEVHEVASNGLFLFVAMHIAYLLILRRQIALSMIFLGSMKRRDP